MNFLTRVIQGFEKTKPLNMVHVQMGEEQIDAPHLTPECLPQTADASPRIEHDQGPVIAADLHA
jgi:hypothetical protein